MSSGPGNTGRALFRHGNGAGRGWPFTGHEHDIQHDGHAAPHDQRRANKTEAPSDAGPIFIMTRAHAWRGSRACLLPRPMWQFSWSGVRWPISATRRRMPRALGCGGCRWPLADLVSSRAACVGSWSWPADRLTLLSERGYAMDTAAGRRRIRALAFGLVGVVRSVRASGSTPLAQFLFADYPLAVVCGWTRGILGDGPDCAGTVVV